MIYLHSVTKTIIARDRPPKLAFRPTTIPLPTDRRVAILGGRHQGKSLLLRLLAGLDTPDTGEIIAPLSLSPIANSRTLLHPLFSGAENIRLFARVFGVDAELLSAATAILCDGIDFLERPFSMLNGPERQQLEIALLSLLAFDCYLLDDASQVPPPLLERYFHAAEARGAGTIFTTAQGRQARDYADYAVVVDDCTVRAFNRVEEAIEAYERKAV